MAEAKMTVVRKSTGEKVELALHHVDRNRLVAGIDIPAYNARLTFTATEKWVTLVSREKIDPEREDATLHVSKSVWNRDFHGVAVWANAILHAKRAPKQPAAGQKQWWLILWQATYANFPEALIKASSEYEALRKARRVPALGAFSVVSDLLSAVPLGTDKAMAQAEMSRQQHEAQAVQERAFHPSPEEAAEREEVSLQLHNLADGLEDNDFSLF